MNSRAINQELDAILASSSDGRLRPAAVKKWAMRHRSSAIYRELKKWTKDEAAEAWLTHLCGNMIRAYYVVTSTPDNRPIKTRAFVSLSSDRATGGGYRPMVKVLSSEELSRQMLADAFAELERFERKYRGLQELTGIFDLAHQLRGDYDDGEEDPDEP